MADKSFINDIEGIRIQNTPLQDDILSQGPEIKRQKVLLFIGAGASIPAGLYSVIGLVDQFKKWLQSEGKTDYLEITQKIITTLQKWKNDRGEKMK